MKPDRNSTSESSESSDSIDTKNASNTKGISLEDGCVGSVKEMGDPREQMDIAPLEAVMKRIAEGETAALVTITGTSGSAPRGLGSMMAVFRDGSISGTIGGGELELFAIRHATKSLEDGRARSLHYDFSGGDNQNVEKACGGTTDFLIQPIIRAPQLIIFGAGHVSRALAPMAKACGFTVTVADDRKEYLDPGCFPEGTSFYHGPFAQTAAKIPFDDSTCAVIMTYGHKHDEIVLQACLEKPWHYLGLMGSRSKVAGIKKRIEDSSPAGERFDEVHTPVGLDIGGRTPAEIAVSIIGEILAVKHGRNGGILKTNH